MKYLRQTMNYLDEPVTLNAANKDYEDKISILASFKKYKRDAEAGDRMAQYQIAKSYPLNSRAYVDWLQKAASQGLTNAMLDLAVYSVEKNIPEAIPYLEQILNSEDSFIKAEAEKLLKKEPKLSAELNRHANKVAIKTSSLGLFAMSPVKQDALEQEETLSPVY